MPRTVTKDEYARCVQIVDTLVQPHIEKFLTKVNEALAPHKLIIGLECKWVFDSTEEQPGEKKNETTT